MHGKDLPRRSRDDDGLFAFDIAPRILSRAQIRNKAHSVLCKVFGDEIPIPVPIETVIRKFDRDIVLIVHDRVIVLRQDPGKSTEKPKSK